MENDRSVQLDVEERLEELLEQHFEQSIKECPVHHNQHPEETTEKTPEHLKQNPEQRPNPGIFNNLDILALFASAAIPAAISPASRGVLTLLSSIATSTVVAARHANQNETPSISRTARNVIAASAALLAGDVAGRTGSLRLLYPVLPTFAAINLYCLVSSVWELMSWKGETAEDWEVAECYESDGESDGDLESVEDFESPEDWRPPGWKPCESWEP